MTIAQPGCLFPRGNGQSGIIPMTKALFRHYRHSSYLIRVLGALAKRKSRRARSAGESDRWAPHDSGRSGIARQASPRAGGNARPAMVAPLVVTPRVVTPRVIGTPRTVARGRYGSPPR